MDLIQQANQLIETSLTSDSYERINAIERMHIPDDNGNRNKGAIKRLNKLLLSVLKARDEIAIELQQESWDAVNQTELKFSENEAGGGIALRQ